MSPLGSRGAQLAALVGALCCMVAPPTVHSSIYAHDGNSSSMVFEDQPSFFGGRLPKDGLMGILVESHPLNACVPIDPPPRAFDRNATKYIVIIRRFDCNFDVKVLHAEQAGYSAAIVYNVHSDSLLNMASDNDTISGQIEIPSVFTSHSAFLSLKEYIIPEAGSYVILWPEFTFPLIYYLIPFTGVMGMIILIMVTILIVRCVQHRKRARRNRLTKEQLKKIPVHKFKKGDEYDMCAICLDEYEDGDKLRILPCSHAYHCRCVDPWLTQTKKTCPVCKQRVIQPDTESEEEDEEEEEGRGAREEADTERTPLLRPSRPGSPSSSDGPGVYSSTAECSGPGPCSDSPLLAHEGYYSPEEEDSDDEEEEEEDEASLSEGETARLLGRGEVQL